VSNVKRGKSTRKFPKGRWEVRWRTPEGKHRTKTFDLKDDAERFAARVETRLADGAYIDREAGATPYRQVAEDWMKTVVHRKPRTVASYRGILNDRLLPAFGEEPVSKITKSRIRAYLAEMAAQGRKPQTIRNAFFALQASLRIAVDDGYIAANPCLGLSRYLPPAAGTKFRPAFLTPAEVERLADAIPEPYPTLIRFAAYTGLRAGEVFALTVSDLNLLRKTVSVSKSRATTGPPLITETKTGEERTVPLPAFLTDLLSRYLADNPRAHTSPLFDLPAGYSHWYTHVFKPAQARAGLSLRFHDLRHTAGSLIDASGGTKSVMERLGHKTPAMALRYTHTFEERNKAVDDALDRAYQEAR